VTLIDSNILIDIFAGDRRWSQFSIAALADRANKGPIAINDVIYAELGAGFESKNQLDREIDAVGVTIARLSKEALYQAGQAYRRYRATGGTRVNVLADFFIGAQASAEGWPILTRDAKRYRTYFRDVEILATNV
jgi:predicted nucleic acid-binding protein